MSHIGLLNRKLEYPSKYKDYLKCRAIEWPAGVCLCNAKSRRPCIKEGEAKRQKFFSEALKGSGGSDGWGEGRGEEEEESAARVWQECVVCMRQVFLLHPYPAPAVLHSPLSLCLSPK